MIPAISSSLPTFDTKRIDTLGTAAAGRSASAGGAGEGADFGAVLARITTDAVGSVKGAEAASLAGIRGEASTQAVVDAVMGAERALQTAVVIRDKVVAAYQEISRMAI